MTQPGYKQFCPVAMAAEMLCTRWTMVLLRELVAGTTRFNDLRRGVPKMSPTLLSQRLKELEAGGDRRAQGVRGEKGIFEYHLTEAGKDLRSVVEAMGFWGQKWVDVGIVAEEPRSVPADVGHAAQSQPVAAARPAHAWYSSCIRSCPQSKRNWWLVVEPHGEVDLCWSDPGFDVDLYVATDLRTMTAIWMGVTTVQKERENMLLTGTEEIASTMQKWLGLSPFAVQRKLAVA